MQIRNIMLGVAGFAVLSALVLLALQVRSDAKPKLDESEMARALAQHRRAESTSARQTPSIPKPRTSARPARTRREPARDRRAREDEPDPNEPSAERGSRERAAPTVSIVGEGVDETTKSKMASATRFYDRGDYPSAEEVALEVLKDKPRHIKMLRIVVSTSCIMGNPDQAQDYYGRLPKRDQAHMRKRCSYYGVELEE